MRDINLCNICKKELCKVRSKRENTKVFSCSSFIKYKECDIIEPEKQMKLGV